MTTAVEETSSLLEGAPNFRDLGGYAVAGGGRILHGRVFRSEVLIHATDADLERIAGLGISLVLDLRLPDERRKERNRWPAGPAPETLVFDDRPAMADAQAAQWVRHLADGKLDAAGAKDMMTGVYRRMPEALAGDVARLVERLAAPAPPPMLVHCMGGKDRTGFVCAMLLWGLGVPWDTIVADYLETGKRRPPERFAAERLSARVDDLSPRALEVLTVMSGVDPDYLEAAFATARAAFGSVDGYLEDRCGLTADRKARLRKALIEAA
jgi:protein-tyrosine phosphatase